MNRKPHKGKSLAEINPELAKEWHPTKNVEVSLCDKDLKKYLKYWWKCDKGDDHEWEANIYNRVGGKGCPICAGQKVVLSTCLATTNPEISRQWHPTKNKELSPFDITEFSNKNVWWKCDKGDDHEWEAKISNRSNGKNCPICTGKKVVKSNCLATINPEITKQWHPTKNGKLTPFEFVDGSNSLVWWKCDKGDDHEWKTSIVNRTKRKSYCPVCGNDKVVKSNCLATINPVIAKQWHPTKNGKLTSYDVVGKSSKIYWWQCDKGLDHEWKSSIANRTNGSECTICSNKTIVLSNCLATTNPKIAKQWHPTKNGKLTPYDIGIGSGKKNWWMCGKGEGHEWKTSPVKRLIGRNCPFCTLTPQSRQELTITFELIKFFDINPKGFKTRVHGKLWSIDIYIEELKLGIEFDGSYWHKDKRALDKLKTEKLIDHGFKIMRIREEPLKAITDIDIISKTPFNAKRVTDDILKHIIVVYEINQLRKQEIKKYFKKRTLQNEGALDEYIEQVLIEKSKKKRVEKNNKTKPKLH